MPHVYVIVSRIFDSYTRSCILMRKQCIIPHEQQIGRHLGTDRLLRPGGGGRWFWRGGYNFKTSPFLGGKFFSGKKHEGGQIL